MPSETTQSVTPRKGGFNWQVPAGLILATGAFMFGTFMALPAVLVAIPRLRRFWALGLCLFLGVLGVRLMSLAGVNPLLNMARDQAVAQLAETLGGDVSYDEFYGEATTGELNFEGLRVALPEIGGEVSLGAVRIEAGTFLLHRPDGYVIRGQKLHVKADASGGKLEKFLSKLEAPGGVVSETSIDGGSIEIYGSPTTANFDLGEVNASSGPNGWLINVGLKKANITLMNRENELMIQGGIRIGDDGSGLRVEADLRAQDNEAGSGILRGTLKPGVESGMLCTIDGIFLNELWARWRKVDTYEGLLRGQVAIRGELSHLIFDVRCQIDDLKYYHYTAMQLDPEHSFRMPKGELKGRIELKDGEVWEFKGLTLTTQSATLSTGKKMNAWGGGKLVLNGVLPELSGQVSATVESGEINLPISWNILEKDELNDIQPNLIIVAEQFGKLDVDWDVDIKELTVKSHPLAGTLAGHLSGTFNKDANKRVGKLRASGELEMKNGRVKCLGLEGDFKGKLIFNPNAPTQHATLRGGITGSLGATPIDCEVTGEISHPGFVFKGANMSPESLGRKIFRYSAEELTPAEQVKRREECNRIFGWDAAAKENPFLAKHSGKVFFNVR